MIRRPRSTRARSRALLVGMLALVAGVGVGCGSANGDGADGSSGLQGVVRKPATVVADVTMPAEAVDGSATPFALRAAPGGLLVVYFGYTSCPDICPTTLSDVGRALDGLPTADRDRVTVALATIDPARDTGAVLHSYLDHFVDGGVALREPDATARAADQAAFRVSVKEVPGATGLSFEHTAVTYVVDDTGTVLVEWPFGTSAKQMRHDLEILLRRAA